MSEPTLQTLKHAQAYLRAAQESLRLCAHTLSTPGNPTPVSSIGEAQTQLLVAENALRYYVTLKEAGKPV